MDDDIQFIQGKDDEVLNVVMSENVRDGVGDTIVTITRRSTASPWPCSS